MWPGPKKRRPPADDRLAALERGSAQLVADMVAMQKRFEELARAAWRSEENERRRIARELHDNLGQTLTILRMRLEKLPEGEARDAAIEAAGQAHEDVRNLSRLLRPPVLDELGLEAALQWLARRMREDAGLPVRVDVSLDAALEDETQTLLFRIAQEALTNVVKHAEATRADLTLRRIADRVELAIRDNGKGFETGPKGPASGVGLAGMKDRAALFGGDLVVASSPQRGTTIRVTLETGVRRGEN